MTFRVPLFARVAFCASIAGLAFSTAIRAEAFRLVREATVDAGACNFETGKWGTSINGQTFQQEALVSHHGYQYAAYFAGAGHPAVARRALPAGAWETIVFEDHGPVTHSNVHNVIVIGIAERDGTVHLSFDHHADTLKYRRSITGLASVPGKHAWKRQVFGPITNHLGDGTRIDAVTYPSFFSAPDGTLTFAYRTGGSGNGDWHLHDYREGKWSRLGMLFSKAGTYEGKTARSAYPNPFRYDRNNRLHVTWCWREAGGNLTANHDLGYAFSDDRGRTWRNNAGDPVVALAGSGGGTSGAISVDTPGMTVLPLRYAWGMMNTTTQFIDAKRRVHVVVWRNPDDAPSATLDKNRWKYHHYWRDVDGSWREQVLPFKGRKPQVVLGSMGDLHVIFGTGENLNYDNVDPGTHLAIATATEARGWKDWRVEYPLGKRRFHGEPLLDVGRWERERVLSVYFQEKPSLAGEPSPLWVLDFKPVR